MLTRHSNELNIRLERAMDIGCAEITSYELLRWYSQERVTVGIWRDIAERWEELQDTPTIPLLVGEATGVWVFVYGEGLIVGNPSWLKDVTTLAKRSSKSPLGE